MPNIAPDRPDPPLVLPWERITTLLLDMDGTLLDRHFDDHFFLEVVPTAFAARHCLPRPQAVERVLAEYGKNQGTLAWYDLEYWSRTLELDIPALKRTVAHLIQFRPGAVAFLDAVRGWPRHLVTNAHLSSLELKVSRLPLRQHLSTITTSHQLGHPKESREFWPLLRAHLGFDPATTLLLDDTEAVLEAARQFGIAFPIHVATPSSALAPTPSRRFSSIHHLEELLPNPHRIIQTWRPKPDFIDPNINKFYPSTIATTSDYASISNQTRHGQPTTELHAEMNSPHLQEP